MTTERLLQYMLSLGVSIIKCQLYVICCSLECRLNVCGEFE